MPWFATAWGAAHSFMFICQFVVQIWHELDMLIECSVQWSGLLKSYLRGSNDGTAFDFHHYSACLIWHGFFLAGNEDGSLHLSAEALKLAVLSDLLKFFTAWREGWYLGCNWHCRSDVVLRFWINGGLGGCLSFQLQSFFLSQNLGSSLAYTPTKHCFSWGTDFFN